MREISSRLIRILAALALLVVALPLQSRAEMPCVREMPKAVAKSCAMACCRAARVERRPTSCCEQKHAKAITVRTAKSADCACELTSKSTSAPVPALQAPSAPQFIAVALLREPVSVPVTDLRGTEPGIVGADAGPPPHDVWPSDLGRAPPSPRA